MGAPIKSVSVIVPLRNERSNVDTFVSDLAAQDFEGDLEVLVADGASDDGSIERLRAAAGDAGLALQVIDNAAGWVSAGLNACIREARGDLIARLDCHSRYPSDYLRRCAEVSERTGLGSKASASKARRCVSTVVQCASTTRSPCWLSLGACVRRLLK